MSNSLRDKVVVVTGASSGIGRSIALESASRGATIILMARHQDKLEEIANEARQLSGNEVFVFPTDISKADQIDRAFNEIISHVNHKAAIIQFSNVLRLELKPFGVKVMTVNPGPVYTNFFNTADESGSYVNNVQRFMLDPDDVAWQVVHFFGSNRRELNLPLSLATLAKLYQIFPRIGDWASLKFASRK